MKYLNTKQVCDMLNISKKKAYELYKVKGFPVIQIGKDYIVEETDLKKFLDMYKNSKINLDWGRN